MESSATADDSSSRDGGARPRDVRAHLEMLRRITRHMTSTQDLASVLSSVVTGLVEHAGMLDARLWLHLRAADCEWCRSGPVADGRPKDDPALHLSAGAGLFGSQLETYHLLPTDAPIPPAMAVADRRPNRSTEIQAARFIPDVAQLLREAGAVGGAAYPLEFRGEVLGSIGMLCRRPIDDEEFALLGIFADQAAMAIKSAYLFRELQRYRDRLQVENAYLLEQFEREQGFEEIVGESPALRAVLRKVRRVAGVDTTVLLMGESGTGKELVARAIHHGSPRRDRPLIKMNCGAIPQGVVESELFGHEKGAFTGALERRIGRFELADRGTLFMDEVGELPLDTQVKLLRVLQEREFERVGSTRSQQVDVRLVAASNRDLEREVAEQRFRSDLFYRLNVFPIRIPPLRERPGDIPLLARHFLAHFQRKMAKPLREIAPAAMQRLVEYDWPGNIRELQNILERACVLADGPVVELVDELAPSPGTRRAREDGGRDQPGGIPSLEEGERRHIRAALRTAGGRVHGPRGAAALLGINPSTLRSRMQKLGIARQGA